LNDTLNAIFLEFTGNRLSRVCQRLSDACVSVSVFVFVFVNEFVCVCVCARAHVLYVCVIVPTKKKSIQSPKNHRTPSDGPAYSRMLTYADVCRTPSDGLPIFLGHVRMLFHGNPLLLRRLGPTWSYSGGRVPYLGLRCLTKPDILGYCLSVCLSFYLSVVCLSLPLSLSLLN